MPEIYVNTTAFVDYHLTRYFEVEHKNTLSKPSQDLKGYEKISIKNDFNIILGGLNRLAKGIVSLYGNDAKKVFEILSDFPQEHIKSLAIHGLRFFELYHLELAISLDDILDDNHIKYNYVVMLLNYLQDATNLQH